MTTCNSHDHGLLYIALTPASFSKSLSPENDPLLVTFSEIETIKDEFESIVKLYTLSPDLKQCCVDAVEVMLTLLGHILGVVRSQLMPAEQHTTQI